MGNALFIVWRESVEAILVVSILYAWIRARGDATVTLKHLWAGVAGGVGLAAVLAVVMLGVQSQLAGNALEAFQAGIVFIAAILITQMVLWMRKHGRHMKRELEAGMARASSTGGVAAAVVAAIAVGREGAETVLFLYGLGLEQSGGALVQMFIGAGLGFALAVATAWLIQRGSRILPSRTFFRITEIVLFMLAAALLVSGAERLINMGWLPPLYEPLWDTSALLSEGSTLGNIAAAFAGYRSQPSLMAALVWFGYWAVVLVLTRRAVAMPAASTQGAR
ncbi:FTR1 family iron permease [Nitrogeniibacter mangrovi]|uniref:FTR1 family iron permease n=1 Tax=Nitrogeniibacter mangrovi TaxID=2016596 RepID=A0A6C1AY46_9RHOO|nr:FTR1 family protein [Nitrogeniibacter mangrovi]QID16276.1 FTR1 family iron permease [Nitrogeniibacter mangrovi]